MDGPEDNDAFHDNLSLEDESSIISVRSTDPRKTNKKKKRKKKQATARPGVFFSLTTLMYPDARTRDLWS